MNEPLTRSEYCLSIRCPRLVWLARNSDTSDTFTEWALSQRCNAALVREYSERIDGAVFVEEENVHVAAAKTADLLAKKKTAIANASFEAGPLSARPDLIMKNSDGTWSLYIIKAATHLRQVMCHDGAYQMFVLAARGLVVSNVYFVHISPDFVGGMSDDKKFEVERITPRTKSQFSSVERRATAALRAMISKKLPSMKVGNGCFTPFDCECKAECFADLPKPNIFDVSGISRQIKFKLFEDGKVGLGDLSDEALLSQLQLHQIDMYLEGAEPEVNKAELRRFIDGLHYPMYFLDFESMQLPSPIFKGTRPYEQVAFQYSLHSLEKRGGELKYTGYIAKPGDDPRREMAERLCSDIPEDACVLAYNDQLEKKVLETLAKMYPDLRKKLLKIRSNVRDMSIPFEKKMYYDARMLGGNSLKTVLHALYPEEKELDYKSLEGVHNGKEAAVAYAMIIAGGDADAKTVMDELEKYCSLDTLGLVKILAKLEEAVE